MHPMHVYPPNVVIRPKPDAILPLPLPLSLSIPFGVGPSRCEEECLTPSAAPTTRHKPPAASGHDAQLNATRLHGRRTQRASLQALALGRPAPHCAACLKTCLLGLWELIRGTGQGGK